MVSKRDYFEELSFGVNVQYVFCTVKSQDLKLFMENLQLVINNYSYIYIYIHNVSRASKLSETSVTSTLILLSRLLHFSFYLSQVVESVLFTFISASLCSSSRTFTSAQIVWTPLAVGNGFMVGPWCCSDLLTCANWFPPDRATARPPTNGPSVQTRSGLSWGD